MKRLALLLLLILFVLPGCEGKRRIEIPLPSDPPNPAEIQPTGPPPAV